MVQKIVPASPSLLLQMPTFAIGHWACYQLERNSDMCMLPANPLWLSLRLLLLIAASSGGSEAVQASAGSMSRMTMFAPRASMVPIGRSSVLPADLLPSPQEAALEDPAVHTPSRMKRMFRSSMEHMKKVGSICVLLGLTLCQRHGNNSPDKQIISSATP